MIWLVVSIFALLVLSLAANKIRPHSYASMVYLCIAAIFIFILFFHQLDRI